jgi:hypothetical protein
LVFRHFLYQTLASARAKPIAVTDSILAASLPVLNTPLVSDVDPNSVDRSNIHLFCEAFHLSSKELTDQGVTREMLFACATPEACFQLLRNVANIPPILAISISRSIAFLKSHTH